MGARFKGKERCSLTDKSAYSINTFLLAVIHLTLELKNVATELNVTDGGTSSPSHSLGKNKPCISGRGAAAVPEP